MEDNIKVSFIQTSYNEKKYFSECIESILKIKTKYSFEILVIDDGSNDGSIDLIKEYQSKYPEIIRFYVMDRKEGINKNNTILATRLSNVYKKGFELARGEYVIGINSDDYYISYDFLDGAIDFLDKNEKYSAYIYGASELKINNRNEVYSLPESLYWATKYLHISNYIIRNSSTFKNNLLPNFCDDTSQTYVVLSSGKVIFNNKNIHFYRKNDSSIMNTTDFNEHMLLEMIIYHEILNYGEKLFLSSRRRFWYVFINLYHDKDKLSDNKYKIYIDFINKYKFNVYNKYMNSGRLYRALFLIKSYVLIVYYYIWKKMCAMI